MARLFCHFGACHVLTATQMPTYDLFKLRLKSVGAFQEGFALHLFASTALLVSSRAATLKICFGCTDVGLCRRADLFSSARRGNSPKVAGTCTLAKYDGSLSTTTEGRTTAYHELNREDELQMFRTARAATLKNLLRMDGCWTL